MTDVYEWNKYIIRKHSIGKGSFSKVYHGHHKETKIEIALKKILFQPLQDNIKDKVISEINILQKMDHPNIMKLYEYRFEGNYIYLVTEYCNNKDLQYWMKTEHSNQERTEIITQIVNGIQYMHRNNILHRDIKPENILLHNGVIKICDFGFSTVIKEQQQMMRTICGTPLFMSPELLFMKPYTIKSDIWSLGILFYMLCYTIHPFGTLVSLDDYRIKIKRSVIYTTIDEISYIVSMIEQMLSYNQNRRPDIDTIAQIIAQKTCMIVYEESNDIVKNEIVKNEDMTKDQLLQRINELEYELFEVEERDSQLCCFGSDSPAITGRGRTNSGYELTITNDYFTPPELQLGAAHISKRTPDSVRSCSIPSSSGSFLSSSIEKISAFFSFGKK